jgi:hypothetical protein
VCRAWGSRVRAVSCAQRTAREGGPGGRGLVCALPAGLTAPLPRPLFLPSRVCSLQSTLGSYNMENGAVIEVNQKQDGGCHH